MFHKLSLSLGVIAVMSMLLLGCSEQSEQQQMVHQAVAIESADECHLCGMLISSFAGPKAELFRKGITQADGNSVKKFCSTRDMFSFYLDPENKRNVTTILVHDMSKAPWNAPKDEFFIDARSAFYVVGSSQRGAMGKTLASFSAKSDAEAFAVEFGGKVVDFNAVNYELLQ